MKKAFPVNINGKIYYIDEDAYTLLTDYLTQLRAAFPGAEGAEIVDDIESRISELFDEKTSTGVEVVNIEFVSRVIETMGNPKAISDEAGFDTQSSEATPPPSPADACADSEGAVPPPIPPVTKKLYRDTRHQVFGGVLAGLGQYFGWDVTALRIIAIVIALCTAMLPCICIYLIAWAVIPPARTPREILEMQGQPVTLGNVGQTVIDNATPPAAPVPSGNDFTNSVNSVLAALGKVLLAMVSFGCAIAALLVGIVTVCIFIALTSSSGMDHELSGWFEFGNSPLIAIMFGFIATFIPLVCMAWAGLKVLLGHTGYNRSIVIGIVCLEALVIATAIFFSSTTGGDMLHHLLGMATMSTSSTLLV